MRYSGFGGQNPKQARPVAEIRRRAMAPRVRSAAVTSCAAFSPGTLNAVDADVSATPHARAASDAFAVGGRRVRARLAPHPWVWRLRARAFE